ncbi:MAG: hypothetical protein MSH11_04815 [Ruminococcus sp.]|nr:hypothetical protein [Ruminococcus sp.]
MKNTFRFSNRLFYSKVLISLILVITMVTSSLPIAYAETNTVNALQNNAFDNGTDSWTSSSDITVSRITEGEVTNNALELTADNNAVYQAVRKSDGKDFLQGTTFKWSLKYKSTDSSYIGALVLGLNEPAGNSDQLRQMMTWLKGKKIDKKVPADGQYTVVVYSKPFKDDGTFDDGKFGKYRANFSLTPTMYCTEKFSVTLFKTTGTDWVTATNPATTPYTLNKDSSSIYYSLISYKGSPLVDDVSFLVEKTGTVVTEFNNLQNGSFENPTIPSSFYYQPNDSLVPDWNTTAFEGKIELFKAEGNSTSGHFGYGKNIAVVDGKQAAELNADEPSTLYQYVNTESGSKYKWQLSHRGRAGSDIMALIIGPKQYDENGNVVDPAKTSKTGNDQFMAMIDWVKENLEYYPEIASDIEAFEKEKGKKDNYKCTPIKMTVYSRPFAENGGFRDGLSTNFSPSESTVFTEKWDISLICTGYQEWGTYGANDSERYSEYDVPEGQKKSIFAFTGYHGTGQDGKKNPTFGNLLDGINFDLYYPASSVSFTGGDAVLTYVYKDELSTSELKSGEPAKSIMVDENSTFTLDVTPDYSKTLNEKGELVDRVDAEGHRIQNTFLGAYITIGGVRKYYPATAINATDNAVYFSETVAEDGTRTYSYGQSNVSGRVVVELVYSEVYTIIYNSKGGKEYSVHSGSYTPENAMDWSGSNANVARFYEKATCTYTSTACKWWEDNPAVVFKGWELVGGTVKKLSDETTVPEDEQVLFKGNATVNYTAPTLTAEESAQCKDDNERELLILEKARNVDFIISDGVYEGRVNAYTGGVLVANWEYQTSVIAQTEQLDGSFINSDVGGQVSLINYTMNITDNSGKVYDAGNKDKEQIALCDKFTYKSSFNNVVTVSNQEKDGYKFLGWYDDKGEKLSSTTNHSYTVEPYYSTSDKTKETQTPAVIYARFGISCKVKFHINDMDTVSTVGNPNADLYRVYYPSTVTIPKGAEKVTNELGITYTLHKLDSNNRISHFYDIPTPVSTNGKIFKGWYLDKDNNADNNPIKWNYDPYTTNTDIYAHWIDVGTMNKDAQDSKIIHQSTVGSKLLPGIDLLGVQIRYEDEDDNYPNGRGNGAGQSPHFDTDGLRFITCIKESVLSKAGNLFSTPYTSANEDKTRYTKQPLRYGYVIAKETTANNNLSDGKPLEYNDKNVNGVDTTTKYGFAKNIDCTSKVGGYKNTTIVDHKNYKDYRIYSLVISYNTAGKTDAEIESAKNQNVVARPYLRYQDANGLYRTYYQDYKGTNVYGGCSTNYNAAKDYLSENNYFPKPKN